MTLRAGSALIGHTGFVGGNLGAARDFDMRVNSTTIGDLAGGRFDLVVCAGVSAAKWLANKDPEADRAAIARLTAVLDRIEAREFVLISTIDVYPDPACGADESDGPDEGAQEAYGRHRLELENRVRRRFETVRVVRLPALFGKGLKKNIVYDLLHGNQTRAINPASMFQWYPVERLADDIDLVRAAGLETVNLFPEPIATMDLLAAFFPDAPVGEPGLPAPQYRLRTRHADLFGGPDGFHSHRTIVLGQLADYLARMRRSAT